MVAQQKPVTRHSDTAFSPTFSIFRPVFSAYPRLPDKSPSFEFPSLAGR
jgi:hypothetical protein